MPRLIPWTLLFLTTVHAGVHQQQQGQALDIQADGSVSAKPPEHLSNHSLTNETNNTSIKDNKDRLDQWGGQPYHYPVPVRYDVPVLQDQTENEELLKQYWANANEFDEDEDEDDYFDDYDEDDYYNDLEQEDGKQQQEEEEEEEYPQDDIGVIQFDEGRQDVMDRIAKARSYIETVVREDEYYEKVRKICKYKNPNCALWAVLGECQNNPAYMNVSCAPVCETCEYLHIDYRCPMDPNARDGLYPGDLNRMFERIMADPALAIYQPKVISRPELAPGDTPETADYALGMWMVQFDNLASTEECERLIELGAIEGYKRSADVGELQEDGTYGDSINSGRTSTNAVRSIAKTRSQFKNAQWTAPDTLAFDHIFSGAWTSVLQTREH